MRGRLGEVTMVPDDFRSTDAVRFPASLDGLRKHFLDIARVLDTTDINFRCHGIRRAEMDAADTAKALIEVLLSGSYTGGYSSPCFPSAWTHQTARFCF